ncbi:ComF family protein [Limnobacter sp.]|uniref:ComF family protein n=1 Tax=Limnobacter sp. TaxID=2003368 RepID=UPI003514CB42
MKPALYKPWHGLCDLLSPRRCALCSTAVPWQAQPLLRHVCASCLPSLLSQTGRRCLGCGLRLGPRPTAFGWVRCRHCKGHTQPWERAVVCADYMPPQDEWLMQLKYGQQYALAPFLAAWLAHTAQQQGATKPDMLVPVPCSAQKLRQRGYNQAALLAHALGRLWGIPVRASWLLKVREVPSQAELDRAERMSNLEGVFVATRRLSSGPRIGLVDDVITTGATLSQCSLALRKAGARHVDWFAICRTPE